MKICEEAVEHLRALFSHQSRYRTLAEAHIKALEQEQVMMIGYIAEAHREIRRLTALLEDKNGSSTQYFGTQDVLRGPSVTEMDAGRVGDSQGV